MDNGQSDNAACITRQSPADERELLCCEEAMAAGPEARLRVLYMLEARINGKTAEIPAEMLLNQSFPGLSFVGITGSLIGRDGLFAQACWFEHDELDWFWVEATNIRSIELRCDSHFRGGTSCLWMTTDVAQYALAAAFPKYQAIWENTLEFLHSPTCGELPQSGPKPSWWADAWTSDWPYEQSIPARYSAMTKQDRLQTVPQSPSKDAEVQTWSRLGPKGEALQLGCQPSYAGQVSIAWRMTRDSGMRKTRHESSVAESQHAGASDTGVRKGKQVAKRPLPGGELSPRRKPRIA